MAISFPTSLDTLTNPTGSDSLTGHALQHANVNDAIEALEAKVGINESADTNSLDYKVANSIRSSEKGAVSGVAPLGADSKVPSAYLPSYVDDVVEVENYAALPGTGESGKIYITVDNNKQFRWTGTVYVELTASPGTTDAVPEGTTNLYFTAQRVRDAVLTGLSLASSAVISATDSVLSALGKLQAQVSLKQDALVSGTNIKTVNGASVLGSGDLVISSAVNDSCVRLNTANGYGSTNNKIRRFSNVVLNQGSDISYADSAALGASFTINTSGMYAISYNDQFNGTEIVGLSLNSTQPTVAIQNIAANDILTLEITSAANYPASVSTTAYLVAGDIVRPHAEGSPSGSHTSNCQFTIARVS